MQVACNHEYIGENYLFVCNNDDVPLWHKLIGTPFYSNAAVDEYFLANLISLAELGAYIWYWSFEFWCSQR